MKAELRHKMDRQLDGLIKEGKNLVDDTKVYVKEKKVEESGMRNLLEMATATDSVEALILFVQYQMGRGVLPKDFGEKLIESIKGLEEKADKISENYPDQKQEVFLGLVRQYLGHLIRYFKFRKKFPEEEQNG